MALPTFRPLSFGEILDGAFTLYRRNLATFLLTALIPTAVVIAGLVVLGGSVAAALAAGDVVAMVGALLGLGLVLIAVFTFSYLVMYGALAREAAQSYTGHATSVADGIQTGMRSAGRLLGASIVAAIGLMVAILGITLVAALAGIIFGALGTAGAVLGGVLMFALFVAGALGAVGLLFGVLPAVVVEGAGPVRAIERSVELARGALGRVVGLMVVTLLITYLPMIAVLALTGGFAQMANPEALPSPVQFIWQQVLSMGVGVVTAPFMVAVMVLLYFDRRVRTEALDVQMMADRLAVATQ